MDFAPRRAAFRKLHQAGCFVMPNPWDPGTARYLSRLGFPALATTSAGFAFSHGLPDDSDPGTCDLVLEHIAGIAAAIDVPVNADFANGYADQPGDVAANVRACVETGVAGLSIEDATGDSKHPLYDLPLAIERIRAAREAIDRSKAGVMLTARAECYLVNHPDPLAESLRRLEAYAHAGADVLYAPGPSKPADIEAIVNAVRPKPVNLLISANTGLTVAGAAALGVRRISVGSSLARTAWTGFIRSAKEIAEHGTFGGFEGLVPYGELNSFFRRDE
jgi:2-methylisocitrate lyase-like PEP mutase family enzyme